MSRLVTKSDALKFTLLTLFVGILLQVIGLWQFALIFWAWTVIFGLVFRHYVKRDRRLAQASTPAAAVRPLPVAPPKASPESSSFDLPEFD